MSSITNNISVYSNFGNNIIDIGYIVSATNQENIVSVSNGKINLLQGRLYYIPIDNSEINSDNYNIKMQCDMADRIEIKFIRDGFACVIPIRHNVILRNQEKMCVLIPF